MIAWPFTRERLATLASLVTIVTLAAVLYQVWDLRDQHTARSLQLLTYADQQLNTGTNVKIRHAIENGRSLLIKNDGPFTREELGDYLDVFEALSDAFDRGQIDLDALWAWHSYYFIKAFENPEVRAFVKQEQEQDPDFYAGFMELGQKMADEERATSKRPIPELKAPR